MQQMIVVKINERFVFAVSFIKLLLTFGKLAMEPTFSTNVE